MVTASERQGTETVSRSVDMFFESNRLRPTIYAEHLPSVEHASTDGSGSRARRGSGGGSRSSGKASVPTWPYRLDGETSHSTSPRGSRGKH